MNAYQSLTGNWKKNNIVTFHDRRWLVLRKGKKNSTLFCLDALGEYDHEQGSWMADHFGDKLNGLIFPKGKPSNDEALEIKREKPQYEGLSFISRIPSVYDLTEKLYPALIDEVNENLVTGKDYWLSNYCGYIGDNEYHFIDNKGKRRYCKGSDKRSISPLLIVISKEEE